MFVTSQIHKSLTLSSVSGALVSGALGENRTEDVSAWRRRI
jgi:hypothetical protein